MGLLIDCYNVLHAEKPAMFSGLEVAGLCRALARSRWARAGREPIVVVCDGSPTPLGLVESPVGEVELIFSGPARTADAVIMDRIATDSAPRRLWVVSSDREIRAAAGRRRARDQSSEAFLHELARDLARPSAQTPIDEKPDPADIPSGEVEAWIAHVRDTDEASDIGNGSTGREQPPQPSDAGGVDQHHRSDHPDRQPPTDANHVDPENDPDIPWPPPGVERW